jgi:ribonuclease HII
MIGLENMPDLPSLSLEKKLWKKKIILIAGIDEAGRGAWAGPVAAAAVILPADLTILDKLSGVRDSKQMTPPQRDYWKIKIQEVAMSYSIGWGTVEEIDALGILTATRIAMKRSIENLKITPVHLLIDAVRLTEIAIPQSSLIKGDVHILSIAAASVLAKTSRDEWMMKLDKSFPAYGFARHKGYGTALHQEALSRFGPCKIHRYSFSPIKNHIMVNEKWSLKISPQNSLGFLE